MPLSLVSIVLNYIDTGPKNASLPDFIAKRWSKITLHVLSKNVNIKIRFIIAIAVLKSETALLHISNLIPTTKKTIRHYKFDELNIIH